MLPHPLLHPSGLGGSCCRSSDTALVANLGTWSLLPTLVRLRAAYNIHSWDLDTLTLCAYVIALGHFGSEWLVFTTAKFGAGLLGPLVVATVSMVLMLTQWNFDVGSDARALDR